ncbi:MAG: hypothetical protein II842_12040 [Butyrivibrio sp.]|nr:hypothetical protein [Butyrivibrio sp.]
MPETKKTEAAKPVVAAKAPVVKEEAKAAAPAAKKTVAKKPAVKKAAAPAANKPAVKKAEPAKTETKKAAAKKAPAKKAATKEAATKEAATKEAAVKTNIVLQYADKNVTFDTLVENAENVYQYDMGKKAADIKKLDLYVKPEENTVYFVVNDKELGNYGL